MLTLNYFCAWNLANIVLDCKCCSCYIVSQKLQRLPSLSNLDIKSTAIENKLSLVFDVRGGDKSFLMRINFFTFFYFLQGSCQFIKCSNGKSCVEDQNAAPQCMSCPRCSNSNKNLTHQAVSKMVCGIDGVTYRSLCHMRQNSCKIGKSIGLLHRGPCSGL